jgi:hypothetical protein
MILPTLDDLANKYSTDKGTLYPDGSRHGYAPFYDKYLTPMRHDPIRMLEVGVWMECTQGGESIRMWNEYFDKASIYTFDIRDMTNHIAVTSNDRVHFFLGDQSNRENLSSMYEAYGSQEFDFILEDGSHVHAHQMISFAHLFKYVKSGGFYILEDMSQPGKPVCCIRNDDSLPVIQELKATGKINNPNITAEEKAYIEEHVDRVEFFIDVKDAYVTAIIFKK